MLRLEVKTLDICRGEAVIQLLFIPSPSAERGSKKRLAHDLLWIYFMRVMGMCLSRASVKAYASQQTSLSDPFNKQIHKRPP
jgi:hypothetical protein